MNKKKIAFFVLNIYQTGGIERVVSIIANSLSEKYDVTIISLFKTADKPIFRLNENISVIPLSNKTINVRKNYFYLKKHIKKMLRVYKFDIFINCGMGYVPLTIFMKKNSTYISWEHSNCNIGKKFGLTWIGRYLSNKYADYIVFLTKRDLKNFKNKFKCNNNCNKLIQIYNPSDLTSKSNGYRVDSNKIISCGRLEAQKGFDILLKVASVLFKNSQASNWSWDIYGDGSLRNSLTKKINELNLNGKVNLKGNANNLEEIYQEYGIFVLTSRYEGFCMVNIEASTNLLPIVSFNCDCGPDEIIIDNVNGYIIDNFNINDMAEKILDLISNDKKRIEFSKNTQLDKEKLELKNIIKKWEGLIEKCGDSK